MEIGSCLTVPGAICVSSELVLHPFAAGGSVTSLTPSWKEVVDPH
jgi:hypothetical protein